MKHLNQITLGLVITLVVATAAQGADGFTSTGSLGTGRYSHTAMLLPSGKVLGAGGEGYFIEDSGGYVPTFSTSAELYGSAPTFLNPILNSIKLGDVSIQFGFINPTGPGYHVLASTDFAAPLNTWSNLGPATDTPPGSGQFQFTDPQAPNYPQRFYRVSSP